MKNKKSVALLSTVVVLFVASIVFLVLVVGTNIFFNKKTIKTDNVEETTTESETTVENVTDTQDNSLEVEYIGENIYAGGRVFKENFNVYLISADGTKNKVGEYKCTALDEDYRLKEGSNTLIFYYNNLSAVVTLEAEDVSKMTYAPNYVLTKVDSEASEKKINDIKSGAITYADALEDVFFIGDSQIVALNSYGLIPLDMVEAKVGETTMLLERMYSTIVAKAYGKKAIVSHFGINSLSHYEPERDRWLSHYEGLLAKLKEDLPGTRIIVSGLFPTAPNSIYKKAAFDYIDEYNQKLFSICQRLDIEYYTNNAYIEANQQMFDGDGLHLTPTFYREYWIYDLIKSMGL